MITPLGGGGSKVVASIIVSCPAGSTLTCTLGSKVLTAKDTSGKWVFGLPSTGSWVVKAVSGSNTTSKTVSITTAGQVANVELIFGYILFKDGAYQDIGSFSNATITSGNLVMAGSGGSSGIAAYRTFITNTKLDLTKYKTLTFSLAEFKIVDPIYGDYRKVTFGVCSNTFGNISPESGNVKASTVLRIGDNGQDKTVTVDISALSGSYYVFVNEDIYGSTTVSNRSIIIT